MATGNKNWTVLCLRAFLLSSPIFTFFTFSAEVLWGVARMLPIPWERNKNIQSLKVEGWVTKTTQVYTSLPQKQQVAKIETSFTFFRSAWDQMTCGILSSFCLRSGGIGKAITAQNWMAKSVPKTFKDLRKPKQLRAPSTCSRCFQPNWKVLANWANYQLIFPNKNTSIINIFETTHFNLSLYNNWWHDDPKGPNKSQRLNLGCGDGGSKGVVCWSSISLTFLFGKETARPRCYSRIHLLILLSRKTGPRLGWMTWFWSDQLWHFWIPQSWSTIASSILFQVFKSGNSIYQERAWNGEIALPAAKTSLNKYRIIACYSMLKLNSSLSSVIAILPKISQCTA